MPVREILLPWERQPEDRRTRIDRTHPLGALLDRAWLGSDAGGIDILSGLVAPPPSNAVVTPTAQGLAVGSTTSGTTVAIPSTSTYPVVLVGYGYFASSASSWRLHALTRNGGGSNVALQLASSTTVGLLVQGNFGTSRTLTVTLPTTQNTPVLAIGVVYSSTDYRLFVNGIQANGTLDAGTPHSLDRVRPPGEFINGGALFAGHGFGRALSDDAFLEITRLPERFWELFEPRRLYVPVLTTATQPTGLATETDSALALAATQIKSTGLANEVDSALALTATQIKSTGLATEVDSALALTAVQINSVGLATEADSAFALTAVQTSSVGLATEVDTALELAPGVANSVGIAVEADIALALTGLQQRTVGMASEISVALPLTGLQQRSVGLASEVSEAFALKSQSNMLVGTSAEIDTAFALSFGAPSASGFYAIDVYALRKALRKALTAPAYRKSISI